MWKLRRAALLLISILFLFPFLFLLLLSAGRNWRFPSILPEYFGFENWMQIFSGQSDLGGSLLISLFISVVVASIATALGFLTSRSIAYHRSGARLLWLAFLPYFLSPAIYAACIYFFFVKMELAGTLPGIMMGQLIIAYPFSVIFFSGYWNGTLRSMEELVNTLGGTSWQALRRVLIPVSRSLLLVCFFQTFLISWFEYALTGILGVGKVQTLTLKVYQYVAEANIYYAALAGCMLVLPPVILLWLNKRFVLRALS